jgi:multiple sugar transport system substrate-binding protein
VGHLQQWRWSSGALRLAVAVLLVWVLGACSGDGESTDGGGGDTGVEITMWTRAATQAQSQRLVDAYNASHENQVQLTAVPTDNYAPRIAAAAGSRDLPDIFAADVIFAPNYTSQGLYMDITDRIQELPFADALAPAHMELGTYEDRMYTVPHTLDLSVLFYNKSLYEQAGLDPEAPPTTLEEFAEHARAIRQKVGGDTYGSFFGGSCGGCFVFTMWPSVWAAGEEVMNEDGAESTINNPAMAATFQTYRDLFAEGAVPPNAKTEQGPTWTGFFPKGNIGVMPMPSTTLGQMPDSFETGVAPIPGPDGGESTFVGGDVLGISATSENADAAWDFIAWTLSEKAPAETMAKHRDVVARTDLADNKYSREDPRVVLINGLVEKGRTPYALRFNETYNDPQSPWVEVARNAIFGPDDVATALREGEEALTASLAQ